MATGEVELERARKRWIDDYLNDPAFHRKVDRLLWDEVGELQATLSRIAAMRRETFDTAFQYELAVRREADYAIRKLKTPSQLVEEYAPSLADRIHPRSPDGSAD